MAIAIVGAIIYFVAESMIAYVLLLIGGYLLFCGVCGFFSYGIFAFLEKGRYIAFTNEELTIHSPIPKKCKSIELASIQSVSQHRTGSLDIFGMIWLKKTKTGSILIKYTKENGQTDAEIFGGIDNCKDFKVSMFSGLVFCKDCGSKLYFCTAQKFTKEQNWFTCAKARKNKEQCTAHFIREVYLENAVLESMRRVFWFARCYEDLFVKQLQEKSVQEAKKELARKNRELEKTEKRIAELDKLFMRIYEDNVTGKLSDDRFAQMSRIYEDEQNEKKALAEQLRTELDKDKEQNDGIEKFIAKVKAITDIQELTPEIVREFISRIDVYAPYRENKQRHQRIDIYYHGIGYVFIPEPEEVEEMFQEHLRDRKDNIKVKTA